METLFSGIYKSKTVLVTGHTGFKGSWLCFWLKQMGANIVGYSLEAPTTPNHFELLDLDIHSVIGNINDFDKLNETFEKYKPDIVFHLAAQALVKVSYDNPIETYETNVLGTLKVLEASKKANVKAIVNITSDKAYENKEWFWGYREIDSLGGYDPYSSSKACADILATSYRNSYFNINDYKTKHNTLLATCRAGNVIGGGDWAKDRLIPDIMISTSKNEKVKIRNPKATRPWQHVLESLSGYLSIGQKLLEERIEFADSWNFASQNEESITVEESLKIIDNYWQIRYEVSNNINQVHEASLLKLDSSKAHNLLKWKSVWNIEKTFEKTINWYKNYYTNKSINTYDDLNDYVLSAKKNHLEWSNYYNVEEKGR